MQLTAQAARPARDLTPRPLDVPFLLKGVACGVVLLWINIYICRDFFFTQTAYMNSMHGFWIAIAKRAGSSWFHPSWWPYWDCGIPFEFTYAPLVPALTAITAAIRGVSHEVAFQSVTGLVYCLIPLTLYIMAWLLTRSPGWSFTAAMFYTLAAPAELLVPETAWAFETFWSSHRLFMTAAWDETPHLAALAILPLAILFLAWSVEKRRPIYYSVAALLIGLAALASAFGPIMVLLGAFCLLFVRRGTWNDIALIAAIGVLGYALAAAFLPPSLMQAMRKAAPTNGEGWTIGSLTALVIVILGWTLLWRFLPRWTADWRLQFFALFAYLTSSIPLIAVYLHRQFLLQPGRYKFEMELALALLIPFAVRPWFAKTPRSIQAALILLAIALAGEQIVRQRVYAKQLLWPAHPEQSIEYRASKWAEDHLPGVRVMFPGTIAQWANDFTAVPQFSGSSWSMAYSRIQQIAFGGVTSGADTAERDAKVSLAWLQAYGVGAVCVSGPKSNEYWKPYAHPSKFENVLPLLWREDDVSIYRVPQRSDALAHVVPAGALVRRTPSGVGDIDNIERFDAALQNPALPLTTLEWNGTNRMRIHANLQHGQLVSVQVSYHPGWHATAAGRATPLHKDGLGLMYLAPDCTGACDIVLEYNGGWELRICRYLSFAALAIIVLLPFPRTRLYAAIHRPNR